MGVGGQNVTNKSPVYDVYALNAINRSPAPDVLPPKMTVPQLSRIGLFMYITSKILYRYRKKNSGFHCMYVSWFWTQIPVFFYNFQKFFLWFQLSPWNETFGKNNFKATLIHVYYQFVSIFKFKFDLEFIHFPIQVWPWIRSP